MPKGKKGFQKGHQSFVVLKYGHVPDHIRRSISAALRSSEAFKEHIRTRSTPLAFSKAPRPWRRGWKHKTETRKKLSMALRNENSPWWGKHLTPEHKAKLRAASSGRKHSEETLTKIRQARAAQAPPRLGKSLSPETRAKISQAVKVYLTHLDYHPSQGKYTDIERIVEAQLICSGYKKGEAFFHNRRIPGTRFFGDFLFPEMKLVLETDGAFWHQVREEKDTIRTVELAKLGWTVIHLPERLIERKDFNVTDHLHR